MTDLCLRCGSPLDPDCPHIGPVCCTYAEMEVRRWFAMLDLDGWPSTEDDGSG